MGFAAVEPVTTRIRRRIPKSPLLAPADDKTPTTTVEQTADPRTTITAAEPEQATVLPEPPATVEPMLPFDEPVISQQVSPQQWRTIARPKRGLEKQLSMF